MSKFKISLGGNAANAADAARSIAKKLGGESSGTAITLTVAGLVEALIKDGKVTGVNVESVQQIAEEVAEEVIEALTGKEVELGKPEAEEKPKTGSKPPPMPKAKRK